MVHLFKCDPKIALYVHIPFCVSKCHYCDFNSIGIGKGPAPELSYLESLEREISQAESRFRGFRLRAASTVFFGGGTPSIFQASTIGAILQALRSSCRFDPEIEITLEMNPKTADLEKMRELRQVGVNRLSIGVQSLQDGILGELGRAHDAADALRAIEWGLKADFERLSVDLMYGLPEQDPGRFQEGLDRLASFPLRHLSAYELIVEENTPFYDRYREDRLHLPPTSQVLDMRERILDFAERKAMRAYEISNYAQEGHESRHNSHYWNYDSFVGFGAGAVSFLKADEIAEELKVRIPVACRDDLYGVRLTNPKSLAEYGAERGPLGGVEIEPISRGVAKGEFMMMGLRRSRGISYADFEAKFREPFPSSFRETIAQSRASGMMEADERGCRFTPRGALLSNEVLREFF